MFLIYSSICQRLPANGTSFDAFEDFDDLKQRRCGAVYISYIAPRQFLENDELGAKTDHLPIAGPLPTLVNK